MLIKKWIFSLFCFFLIFSYGKVNGQSIYEELRNVYDSYEKNDKGALPYVARYITKARQEKNFAELKQGYEDYSYYSSEKKIKLQYADSAVTAAQKSEDHELMSSAHLYKGSIYYFYFKNYNAALDESLKAYHYSKNIENEYLRFKVIYQMGLVKSYLGYYHEAVAHFNECISYFEPKTNEKSYPSQIYNDTKGYLNSLHQAIVCYQHLKNYKTADSLTVVGMRFTGQSEDFVKEKTYFLKSRGISDYYFKRYGSSIENLSHSLPVLLKNDEVYWISVAEFYIGKSLLKTGKENQAVKQFEKVDSIFKKREFFFPELQENYELLIYYHQKNKNENKELSYTKDLLKVDNILKKDFPNLSSKIHRGYDNEILSEAKSKLEAKSRWGIGAIIILVLAVIILSVRIRSYYNHTKEIKIKYAELEVKLQQNLQLVDIPYKNISLQSKNTLSEEVFLDIQTKLKIFEENKGFTESGLTIEQLAEAFKTNKYYLSQYINDITGMNFSKYISALRINYITQLMFDQPQYLRLKVQSLAEECGIASRANFSNLFQEINGLRPADFIKQRKIELEQQENASVLSS
ncbi:AraC family transcriptional regulator [Chryseobacterium aahli]|uniref:helix-turn-helix domain-containing protein n=1 Tax=Chryseobacterium aahli TaxID=1278643 RepID=UPI001F616799|nr:AraC family transcriptional regulator [Chryseobacterium aahli]MCI3938560.1 AraC family transcriptional regulator [Chryseobacterium aahli]